jgi:hypothetical protein
VLQSERVEITLPKKTRDHYAGIYELRPGTDIQITVAENRLMGAMTRQPPDPLYAETKSLFFSKRFDADLEFVRDSAGKVSAVILHQGGREQKAMRKD